MYDLKKVNEAINLMIGEVETHFNKLNTYYSFTYFEMKQAERNPLLIKIKQLRKQLNNKKRG